MKQLTKKEYEKFLDVHTERLLQALKKQAKRLHKQLLEAEVDPDSIEIDKILTLIALLIYNYVLWRELGVDRTEQYKRFLRLPEFDEAALRKVARYIAVDKALLKRILGARNTLRLFKRKLVDILYPLPPEVERYFSELEDKLIMDAVNYLRKLEIELLQKGYNTKEREEILDAKLNRFLENRSKAIAYTETARLYNLAILQAGSLTGVVAYRYQAVVDNKTCELCLSLNGRYILARDFATLAAYSPPRHPFCRCRLIPVTSLPSNARFITGDEPMGPRRPVDYQLVYSVLTPGW